MSSRKRSYQELLDVKTLDIVVADGTRLPVNERLIRATSSCASGLPTAAAEWDLRQLVLDGKSVSREVVVAWLHAAHMCLYDEPYAAEQQSDPALSSTAAGLAQLLAFADAVGSTKGVLKACLQHCQLAICLQVGEQHLKLQLGVAHWWDDEAPNRLWRVECDHNDSFVAEVSEQQATQQFAQQVEALLFLAHKLQLRDLIEVMHTCVRRNKMYTASLLSPADTFAGVMSARVLDAAAGPGEDGQLAYINSVLLQPCAFGTDAQVPQLLKPVRLTDKQQKPIKFTARLMQDFRAPGDKGKRVNVELDLFNDSLDVEGSQYDIHLMVGGRQAKHPAGVLHQSGSISSD